MTKISKILLKLGLIKMNLKRLEKRYNKKDLESIHWALQFGMYDVRQAAAKFLGSLNSTKSIQLLTYAIDDKIKNVSTEAMKTLIQIGLTSKLEKKIKAKKEYWIEVKKQEIEDKKNRKKVSFVQRNERPSKKTFENIKKLLQRPSNTGKWF